MNGNVIFNGRTRGRSAGIGGNEPRDGGPPLCPFYHPFSLSLDRFGLRLISRSSRDPFIDHRGDLPISGPEISSKTFRRRRSKWSHVFSSMNDKRTGRSASVKRGDEFRRLNFSPRNFCFVSSFFFFSSDGRYLKWSILWMQKKWNMQSVLKLA